MRCPEFPPAERVNFRQLVLVALLTWRNTPAWLLSAFGKDTVMPL